MHVRANSVRDADKRSERHSTADRYIGAYAGADIAADHPADDISYCHPDIRTDPDADGAAHASR